MTCDVVICDIIHFLFILGELLYLFIIRVQQDVVFEVASMLVNVALWYTKHAATIASKEEYVFINIT